MTPEHDDLTQEQVMEALVEMTCVSAIYPRHRQAAKQTIAAITQLQEQNAAIEAHNKRLNQLMDGMDEYQADIEKTRPLAVEIIDLRKGSKIMHEALGEANREKDKLQAQNANYKEQIKALVAEKYKNKPEKT